MRDARLLPREGDTLIGVIEEWMMGAYSTTRPRSGVPARGERQAPPSRPLSAILSRTLAWLVFVGGLVGAVLGIAGLHVEITVAGLILACTTGLVLLKLRAGDEPPHPAD